MDPMRLRLIYFSVAPDVPEAVLQDILTTSVTNNRAASITGLLLYGAGNFVQILEGPDENVRNLLDAINADTRHSGLEVIMEEPFEDRVFGDWNMAYLAVDEENAHFIGGSFEADSAEGLMAILKMPESYAGGFMLQVFKTMLGNTVSGLGRRD